MGLRKMVKGIFSKSSALIKEVSENGIDGVKSKADDAMKTFKEKSFERRSKFVDNVLVGVKESDYKDLKGGFKWASKGSLMDEAAFHVRGVQDLAIGAMDFATNGIGERHYGRLLRRADDSLVGYRATKLGIGVAATAAVASGTPEAARQFNENRQGQFTGTYQMGALPGLVPQGHAYANNAGATGDLVLALNNNR